MPPESLRIAPVRIDVVDLRGLGDDADPGTEAAQRVLGEERESRGLPAASVAALGRGGASGVGGDCGECGGTVGLGALGHDAGSIADRVKGGSGEVRDREVVSYG